jgi:hypothetical protein
MTHGKEDSMSHVDEGTLHSYLDGELSPEERAAVESHLSQCATCRASLAEERALLDRASALLGSARPVERPAPSFEQLRRESKRSPWRVRRSIAWAASIVLAVGLGYSLRGAAPETSDKFALYDRREPAATIQNRPATDQGQFQARSARRPALASAPPATPAADEVARQREKDTPAAKVASRAEPITREEAPSAQAVAPASLVDARADTVARKQVDNYQLDALVVTGRAAANAGRAAAAPQVRSTLTEWPIITRAAARALLGTDPMGLPGLATRRIRRSPGTDRTVIVEQAVDSSTVIQILQKPANTALYDSSAGGYAYRRDRERADRLARFVGTLRVEITGPLSVDSLNRLLEQVAPLP